MTMVFDTTHPNEDFERYTKTNIGPAFSLLERLKMGRIGSRRMVIQSYSAEFWPLKSKFQDLLYGNIELRPQGIIVYAVNGEKRMGWIIPYRELIIFDSDCFSLHAQGLVIKFEKNRYYKENKSFIRMMMSQRLNWFNQYEMPFDAATHD